jgi:hypothetical protein
MDSFSLLMDLFAGAGVFSGILNVWELYALGSHATIFNLKYMLCWRVRNIAFCRSLSTEQYQSALIVGLLLALLPCFPELCYSAEILFKNWLCLTDTMDTVVSIEMRRPTHLQGRDQVLHLWGRSFVKRRECEW